MSVEAADVSAALTAQSAMADTHNPAGCEHVTCTSPRDTSWKSSEQKEGPAQTPVAGTSFLHNSVPVSRSIRLLHGSRSLLSGPVLLVHPLRI